MTHRVPAAVALVVLAVAVSACAVGEPKPPTYVSDRGTVLVGNVHSNGEGSTSYWFRYGQTAAYGQETGHRTVGTTNDSPHPVSVPIDGLGAGATYHWQLCVNDGAPSRDICSKDQTFTTKSAGGSSGIAFVSTRGVGSDIFVMDTDGQNQTNLTNTPAVLEDFPAWSPDGKKIAYTRGNELWTMNANGSNQTALTNTPTVVEEAPAWSPDGAKIAFQALSGADREIFTVNAGDGSGQTQLTDNAAEDRAPAWSPDGAKIAFDSDRSAGTSHIYLMGANGTNQTLFSGNPEAQTDPVWSLDRNTIAYTDQATGFTVTAFDSLSEGDTFGAATGISISDGNSDDSRVSYSLLADPAQSVGFVAFQRQAHLSANSEIFKTTSGATAPVNLTNNAAPDSSPAWSPRP